MRFIDANKLKVGQKLGSPIYDSFNRLLVNRNIPLNEYMINKIQELGIDIVCIYDEISDDIDLVDVVNNSERANIYRNLKNFDVDKSLNDAKLLVSTLKYDDEMVEYINEKTIENYTYAHSLSVAIYATMIGIAAHFNTKELNNLCAAGLLHDVGKKEINQKILNKPGKLTNEEYEHIKKHSSYGYKILKNSLTISSTIKMGVYSHHENEDGSGYPRQVKGNKIYKFAKIIHIVDVYDALISKRPYKEPKEPKEAMEFIKENIGSMFDPYYVNLFLYVMPAYPKGTKVLLSNGEYGVVIKNYKGYTFQPDIQLKNKEILQLRKNNDIEIIKRILE